MACAADGCTPRPCESASYGHLSALEQAVPSASNFECICPGNDCRMFWAEDCETFVSDLNEYMMLMSPVPRRT